MCIPGLGENNNSHRPYSSGPRSASSVGEALSSEPSSTSSRSAQRPMTAPVNSDRRIYNRRTANRGGASDSSQMSSLMWQPLSPDEPIKETFADENNDNEQEADTTPYFSSDNSVVLIKGGSVVNCDEVAVSDVLVEDGKITAMGEDINVPEGATVIDASGKYVMPGGIDMNTHFCKAIDKSAEVTDDFESGTKAAVTGGTTLVVDLVVPEKDGSLIEAFEEWKEMAAEKSCCDYAFTVAVPHVTDESKEEMEKLAKEHGVNSFKMFMAYKDTLMLDNKDLMEAFKHVKELGCIAKVHAENGDSIDENIKTLIANGVTGPEGHPLSRPVEVEEEAVRRACTMAKQVNVPLNICGVTSSEAVEIIKEFKEKDVVVIGEPSVSSLVLDGSSYQDQNWTRAAAHVMSPPLRDAPENKDDMLDAVTDGSLDIVSSDHCSYDSSVRAQGKDSFADIPQGVNGVEERMSLIYERGVVSGKMELTRFVEVTSTAAAKLLNVYPRKGCIAEGSDADIVIWDAEANRTIQQETQASAADTNIYEGQTVTGVADFVLCSGKIVVAEKQVNTEAGSGQYVETLPWPEFCYEKIKTIDGMEKPEPVVRDDIPRSDSVDGPAGDNRDDSFGLTCPRGYRAQEVFNKELGIYQRPLSAHGVRNQQDSSFSLSGPRQLHKMANGEGGDAHLTPRRAAVRVNGPPGGQGGAFW